MPKELDIRALVESKMRPELVAIAEAEGATYSERGTKRDIAVEILEAREELAKLNAAADALGEIEARAKPEAELETDVEPEPVKAAPEPETVTVVRQEEGAPTVTEEVKATIAPEYVKACNALSAASAAFNEAGQVDGPERKARREAKAKLYALLA